MKVAVACALMAIFAAVAADIQAVEKKEYGYEKSYGHEKDGYGPDKSYGHGKDGYGDDKAYGYENEYGYEEKSYDHDKSYGKKDVEYRHGVAYNKQYTYHGKYEGHCAKDGFYYKDYYSFVICSNNNAYVQPCAPGSRNSAHDVYNYGNNYYYRDFCDVNLVDYGYGVKGYQGYHGYDHGTKGYGHNDGYYGGYHGDRYNGPAYGYDYKGYGYPYGAYGRGYAHPKGLY